jgi:hypothetical protein
MNGERCWQGSTRKQWPRDANEKRSRRYQRLPAPELLPVTQDINVLALVKGEERYIFLYDDEHKSDALKTLGRFASNPELSFSWYDAAVLSQRIRQTAMEQRSEAEAQVEAEPAVVNPPRHKRFKLPLAE